ncbi:putative membrane protein YedE/YeeE [Rhodanobacter sp. TND4EL1]
MKNVISVIAGILFGFGLALAQMTDPAKVIGFLDVTGNWDPTLALVLGGAVLVTLVSFRFILRRARPVFDVKFNLPTRRDIDSRLILGAALFGVGWGLAGLCPGPGVAAIAQGAWQPLVFVVGLAAGMLAFRYTRQQQPQADSK